MECNFHPEGDIVVCYNGNEDKWMIERVKILCKDMEEWKKKMHSEKITLVQKGCRIVRVGLRWGWEGKQSQTSRGPSISFVESITPWKCLKLWMFKNVNFSQERSESSLQILKSANWLRTGRWGVCFPCHGHCPGHGPQVTSNGLQYQPGYTGCLAVGPRLAPAKSPPKVQSCCQAWTRMAKFRPSKRLHSASLWGQKEWVTGQLAGQEAGSWQLTPCPREAMESRTTVSQDSKCSVNAPWPHQTSLSVIGWLVFSTFLWWTPNSKYLMMWLYLETGSLEVIKMKWGHLGDPSSNLTDVFLKRRD